MLELTHIVKKFQGKEILADINLHLNKGAICCLSGPSGIGKSTLLDVAAGLTNPDAGSRWVGTERIGYAFQEPCLIPWRTAFENIEFVLSGSMGAKNRTEKAMCWLKKLGLADAAHKKPAEMSGGMCRRLCLATALATDPEMVFLDEPFAFLDKDWQQGVAEELIRLNVDHRLTILMVSHQPEPVAKMNAEIIRLDRSPLAIK
jgi:ABC-type nitrate/sulfonate/bicarbonate transport system ATPase subunit